MKRLLAAFALTLSTITPAAALPGALKNTPFDTKTWGGAASDVRDGVRQRGDLYFKVKGHGCLYFDTHKYIAFRYKTFRRISKWKTGVWKTTDSGKKLYFFDTKNRYIYAATGNSYREAKRNLDRRGVELDLGRNYGTRFVDVCN